MLTPCHLAQYNLDMRLAALEAEAEREKRGLWVEPDPISPWEWRKQRREKGALRTLKAEVVPDGVEIVALLPNPKGPDKGHEQGMIGNCNPVAIELDGWKLQDRAGKTFRLVGTVPGRGRLVFTMTDAVMQLNNDGDEVSLTDPEGVVRSRVGYGKGEVRPGKWIERPR